MTHSFSFLNPGRTVTWKITCNDTKSKHVELHKNNCALKQYFYMYGPWNYRYQ